MGVLIRSTTKRDRDGVLIQGKVRAALRGDLDLRAQELFPGVFDTYSPSLGWNTYFMVLALAALYGWDLSLIDVTAAFAYNVKREHPMFIRMNPHWFRDGIKKYPKWCVRCMDL